MASRERASREPLRGRVAARFVHMIWTWLPTIEATTVRPGWCHAWAPDASPIEGRSSSKRQALLCRGEVWSMSRDGEGEAWAMPRGGVAMARDAEGRCGGWRVGRGDWLAGMSRSGCEAAPCATRRDVHSGVLFAGQDMGTPGRTAHM